MKVLVVDDDTDILEAIDLLLDDHGFEVETMENAEGVVQKVISMRPAVVLLDVLLAGMDGREVCRKLKKNKETASVPVVMMSAYPTIEKDSLECGALACVAKPFEVADLIEKLNRVGNCKVQI